MCKCTPNIRTPFCGKPGCEWPNAKKPEGARDQAPAPVSETKLLPCAHCGGEAADFYYGGEHWIGCTDCGARTKGFANRYQPIDAWERRTPATVSEEQTPYAWAVEWEDVGKDAFVIKSTTFRHSKGEAELVARDLKAGYPRPQRPDAIYHNIRIVELVERKPAAAPQVGAEVIDTLIAVRGWLVACIMDNPDGVPAGTPAMERKLAKALSSLEDAKPKDEVVALVERAMGAALAYGMADDPVEAEKAGVFYEKCRAEAIEALGASHG